MKNRFFSDLGYTLTELLLVASVVGAVPTTVYLGAQKMANTAMCVSNLRNISMGIQMYEIDFDAIPDADFFPESPRSDPESIINILGEHVSTLVDNESRKAGYHVAIWNGRNGSGLTVASGVYFVQLQADNVVMTRKMLLVE